MLIIKAIGLAPRSNRSLGAIFYEMLQRLYLVELSGFEFFNQIKINPTYHRYTGN